VLWAGSLEGLYSRLDRNEFFYKYTSFNDPGSVFRAVVKPAKKEGQKVTISHTLIHRSQTKGLNPDNFVTDQVRGGARGSSGY